jgi:hypothetical protein
MVAAMQRGSLVAAAAQWRRALSAIALLAAVGALIAGASSAPARPQPAACKNVINGTAASESLDGTAANDRIGGLAGDDRLTGEGGNDCLDGGLDSDALLGGAGDDLLEGSSGNDTLSGEAGADDLKGGRDVDRLDGGDGNDRLWGGGSTDFLHGGPGADVLRGGSGSDRLYGGAGRDTILGGPGNDDIREVPDGYAAADGVDSDHNKIDAGPGRDRLNVANGRRDEVDCGPGRDTVKADKGDRLKHCEKRRYLISPFPAVTPHRGGPARRFLIKFRSLETVGRSGEFFSVSVKGPPGSGCKTLTTNSLGVSYHRDRAVRYRLRPFAGKGRAARRWCHGLYRGAVTFMRATASCSIAPDSAPPGGCAEEVPIGRFSFRVRG